MVCRLHDARAFVGAAFDDMDTGMARAGLAWDRAGDYLGRIAPGSGPRTFGHWEGAKGARVTEQTRQRPDILEALRHLPRRCF